MSYDGHHPSGGCTAGKTSRGENALLAITCGVSLADSPETFEVEEIPKFFLPPDKFDVGYADRVEDVERKRL